MTWSEIATSWAQWCRRFRGQAPDPDDGALTVEGGDRALFEAHLAQAHDLTRDEAREALDDFRLLQELARSAFDYRAIPESRDAR